MFGVPFENLDLASLPQYPSEIPAGLQMLKQYLIHSKAFHVEGILTTVSNESSYKDAIQAMDRGERIETFGNITIAAQMIKQFYREYPIPTPGFFSLSLMKARDDIDVILEFNKIKDPIYSLILWCLDLCLEINEYEKENKMSLESLSICFSPNMVRHEDTSSLLTLQRSAQRLFEKLLVLRKKVILVVRNENNKNEIVNFSLKENDRIQQIKNEKIETEQKHDEIHSQPSSRSSSNSPNRSIKHSMVCRSSVQELYHPSFNNGSFGSYVYPLRKTIYLQRDIPLNSNEIAQQLGTAYNPCFRLSFFADNEEAKVDVTQQEKSLVAQFEQLLKERYNCDGSQRSELLRYVIGCKHRLDVAERRFLNLKKLEREFKLNDVSLHQVRDELKKPCYMLCGQDIQGRAIMGFNIAYYDPKNADISVMMKSVLTWCDSICSDISACRNGVVLIFDMASLGKDNFSADLEKVFIRAFQEAYPLRIKQFIIVNAPIHIRAAIQIGKLFLSKKLSERVTSVKTGPNLWQLVHPSQVPSNIGGTLDKNNDGKYPTNAWNFVCSKIVGDLPSMVEISSTFPPSTNLGKHHPASNEQNIANAPNPKEKEDSVSDRLWMKEKENNHMDEKNNNKEVKLKETLPNVASKSIHARNQVEGQLSNGKNMTDKLQVPNSNDKNNNNDNNNDSYLKSESRVIDDLEYDYDLTQNPNNSFAINSLQLSYDDSDNLLMITPNETLNVDVLFPNINNTIETALNDEFNNIKNDNNDVDDNNDVVIINQNEIKNDHNNYAAIKSEEQDDDILIPESSPISNNIDFIHDINDSVNKRDDDFSKSGVIVSVDNTET